MKFPSSTLLIAFFISPIPTWAAAPPMYRFQPLFDALAPAFQKFGANAEKAADFLLEGDMRNITFKIQGLGRLYEKKIEEMEGFRDDFKGLELEPTLARMNESDPLRQCL